MSGVFPPESRPDLLGNLPPTLGRGFGDRDDSAAPRVAVVNRAFVSTYFAGDNPVGRQIGIGPAPTDEVEIVGVAGDAKYTELRGATPPTLYLPALQRLDGNANFAVRAPDLSTAKRRRPCFPLSAHSFAISIPRSRC